MLTGCASIVLTDVLKVTYFCLVLCVATASIPVVLALLDTLNSGIPRWLDVA